MKISSQKIRDFIFKTIYDEEFCNIYDFSSDESQDKSNLLVPHTGPITNFFKYNRRITEKLCEPIIALDDRFFYCGVARMPGLWISSILRKSEKNPMGYSTIKTFSSFGRQWKSNFYSRQEHLVESCTRHLMRKELESFLGECKYALTCYTALVRFTVPYDERFMIFVNTDKEIVDSSDPVNRIVEYIEDGKFISDLIKLCNDEQNLLDSDPNNKTKLVNNFIHGKLLKNPIEKKLKEKFIPKTFIILDELFFQQFRYTKSTLNAMSANLFDIAMGIFNFGFYNYLMHQYQQEFSKGSPKTWDDEFNSKIRKFIEDALFDKLDKDFHPTNNKILYEKEFKNLIHDESLPLVDQTYSKDEQIRKTLIPIIIKKFIPNDNDSFNDSLENVMLKHIEDNQINFLEQIRYAAVVSMKNYPLGRYIRPKTPMLLTGYDQLDHLVESISRQKLRKRTIRQFGPIRFTFSVYEKLIRLSVPLNDDFVLFLTLDHNPHNPAEYYPHTISQILDHLKSVDSTLFDQK